MVAILLLKLWCNFITFMPIMLALTKLSVKSLSKTLTHLLRGMPGEVQNNIEY